MNPYPRIAASQMRKRSLPALALGAALIGKEETRLVLDVLRRREPFRYYGHDPKNPPPMARTLEREFREMMGTKYALAVTSGTAALEVALGALDIGPGDEVIIPVWSWDSCFTSVVRMGAVPVLAEIDDTLCLDARQIARLRTPRTKAVMVVHYQGVAADMDPIRAQARKAGLKVIEDCAESPGALYHGKRVGSMGDIGTFSFQFAKSMTSGEGGMVVTSDARCYERAVRMHDIGQYRAHHARFLKPKGPSFCGSQYRMSELSAAVALAQLRKLERVRTHCRMLQNRIMARIGNLPGLRFRRIPDPMGDSGFEIYFWLKTKELADRFAKELGAWNVRASRTTGTSFHFLREYCRQKRARIHGYRQGDFPRSESLMNHFIALPLGVLHTAKDADYIAEVVCRAHERLRIES